MRTVTETRVEKPTIPVGALDPCANPAAGDPGPLATNRQVGHYIVQLAEELNVCGGQVDALRGALQ